MAMEAISEHVYGIFTQFGFLNMYLIADGDQLALIDTGMGATEVTAITAALEAKGWSWANVAHILITHGHYDHIGGLHDIQQLTNAHTMAHRVEAPLLRGTQQPITPDPAQLSWLERMQSVVLKDNSHLSPARVDTELADEQILDRVLAGLRVVHLAGHSYGQVGYYLPQDDVLIAGDALMHILGKPRYPFKVASPDWNGVIESIQRIHDLNPRIICVGHGRPIVGDIQRKFARLLR